MKSYIYIITVDDVVRYVGKGTGDRLYVHMKIVRNIVRRRSAGQKVKTTKFYNRLTKAFLSGAIISTEIIDHGLTDDQAFDREIEIIAIHSTLWNTAPGGQGFSTDQWSDPQFRRKMRLRELSKQTAEYRVKRSMINKAKWDDPVVRAKWIAAIWSDARRAKMAVARALKRAKVEERIAKRKYEIEQRRIERENNKRGYHKNSGSFTSERSKIIQLAAWRNPEKRAKRLKLFSTPEYRKKVSEGLRKARQAKLEGDAS
jgi:hypothetical protein